FFGTFAPFLRASERPMAIACFLLVTTLPLPPFPERRVSSFSRRTALSALLPAAFPYFAILFCLLNVESLHVTLAFVCRCANRVLPVAMRENVRSVCGEVCCRAIRVVARVAEASGNSNYSVLPILFQRIRT